MEDDAVHGAAAAGRAGAGAARICSSAAQVDGAGAWRRLIKVTLPLIKPAILVALLFRTLDAFRIFDNIYVLTGGANDTGSVSILGYDNLFKAFNLGSGLGDQRADLPVAWRSSRSSTSSCSAHRRPARTTRCASMAERVGAGRATGWIVVDVLVVLYALFPVLWILSLSLKPTSTVKDGKLIPSQITFDNYKGIFTRRRVQLRADQLDRHRADHHGDRGRRSAGWRPMRWPGWSSRASRLLIGVALLIAMFPQISLVTPLFNIERSIGLFDTWPGLIIPYITFALPLAIYTLSAFFREIPWDLEKAAKMDGATPAQAFRKVIAPLAAPGIVTAAILVFIFAWNDLLLALSLTATKRGDHRAGGDRELHRQFAIRGADRIDRRRRDGHHGADHHLRSHLPTTDRRRADVRCGEGVGRWPRSCWTR